MASGFRTLVLFEVGGVSTPYHTITGTLTKTNSNDTLNASGSSEVSGTLNKTNNNDTLSSSGSVGTIGGFRSLALFEIGGISRSSTTSGTLNTTNDNDSINAVGNVPVVVIGIASRRNKVGRGPYSLGHYFRRVRDAFTNVLPGTLNVINNNDTLAATGWANTITGSLAKTNNNDTLSASGTNLISGTLNVTNNNDTMSAQGTPTVNGTLTKTNNNDTLSSFGTIGTTSQVSSFIPLTGAGH